VVLRKLRVPRHSGRLRGWIHIGPPDHADAALL